MKKVIFTEKAPAAIGPYSQAVEVNGMVFLSGQIPVDPATGEFVPGGVAEQTAQAFENIKHVLASAGLTTANNVKTTDFLVLIFFIFLLILNIYYIPCFRRLYLFFSFYII